jgi:uncharacterized protein (TIGR02246 family)
MKKTYLVAAACAASLLAAGLTHAQDGKKPPPSADELAVRAIPQQMADGWNAGSGKGFAAPFALNADYVVVNGMHIKGHPAIEAGHQQIFDTIYKGSKNEATVVGVRFLRPDVALLHTRWKLKVGGEEANAISTIVATKENGKWTVAAFQNTPVQGPPPRP